MDCVVWRPLDALREFPGNPRRHPEGQIASLMKSIRRFWTNPILVDETGTILAGHGRCEAAKRLGMKKVPTVTVSGLSDSDKRAVVIADNRLPEQAVWDFDLLRDHFRDLIKFDFDVELTEPLSVRQFRRWVTFGSLVATAWPAATLCGERPTNSY